MCQALFTDFSHLGFLITYFIDRKTKSEKLINLLSFVCVSIVFFNSWQNDCFQAPHPSGALSLQNCTSGGKGDRPEAEASWQQVFGTGRASRFIS